MSSLYPSSVSFFGFSNKANHKPTSATAEALAENMIALISLCEVEAGLGLCSSQQELSIPMKWLGWHMVTLDIAISVT